MAFTSTKMGLRIWNLLSDLYDHAQLADNWAKVDYHDHSPGKGVQIPTEGVADGAITAVKLATSADPTGAFSTYRTYWRGTWQGSPAAPAATWAITPDASVSVGNASSAHALFYIDPADFINLGKTAYMRLEMDVFVNTFAPATNYTLGLYPMGTLSGGASIAPITSVGTVVAGSQTATVTAPAASSATHVVGSDFAIPVAGFYLVGLLQDGAAAASSVVQASCRLAVRAV